MNSIDRIYQTHWWQRSTNFHDNHHPDDSGIMLAEHLSAVLRINSLLIIFACALALTTVTTYAQKEVHLYGIYYCGEEHHHPVDIAAKYIADSLRESGVDTILIYRHWLYTNGFNGYGKVLWKEKGIIKQYHVVFANNDSVYGIYPLTFSVVQIDSIFSFYFQNQLNTITSNPSKKEIEASLDTLRDKNGHQIAYVRSSHDAEHFVWLYIRGYTYCYYMDGEPLSYTPHHPRSRFLYLLREK